MIEYRNNLLYAGRSCRRPQDQSKVCHLTLCWNGGVVLLPDEGKRKKRERYRQLRVPKHVLDRFIQSNTVQADTTLSLSRNRRRVRTRVQ